MDNIDQASNTDPFQTGSRHIKWRGGLSKRERNRRSQHYQKNGIGFLLSSNSATAGGSLGLHDIERRFRDGLLASIDRNLHSFQEIVDFIHNLTEAKMSIDKISILKQLPVGRQINVTQIANPRTNLKIDVIALRLTGYGKLGTFNITLRNHKTPRPEINSTQRIITPSQGRPRNKPNKTITHNQVPKSGNYIRGFEALLDYNTTSRSRSRMHGEK